VLVDLHSHYPMHLLADEPKDVTLDHMVRGRPRPTLQDKLRAWLLGFLARFLNYRRYSGTWRVDLAGLEQGDVRAVCSVLYRPFDEMDLQEPYGAKPEHKYFKDLLDLIDEVEAELRRIDPAGTRHRIVKSAKDLDDARQAGQVAFLHCVEGGFHLGATPGDVTRHVQDLAARGVVYITLAHLFWRQVATNAPALPFLPDSVYNLVFPQPREGLTELGIAAVTAMHERKMLVDVSHMREDALKETFALLDRLDPEKRLPVIASHSGYRFGSQTYNLTPDTVRRIAARNGVIGLILAQHQLNDGIRSKDTKELSESMDVLCRHIDAIHDATGSHDHVAIGSDFDGFIKPTMGGLESAADLAKLRAPLTAKYGATDTEKILTGNALRVIRSALT
jgi:microsomal dipeptidase-like Zn-dependent dipeptidase